MVMLKNEAVLPLIRTFPPVRKFDHSEEKKKKLKLYIDKKKILKTKNLKEIKEMILYG